ncbi:hypothetical protein DFP98_113182 [Cohnella phaseoli]|uniref:Uncharacterized protein n=1 Tax=Cohnella phaseoli TaxID=456490 RepID=A0A3D9JPT5_9BACL|nr:hypothetical protein DFP98_113182 [Cohnella phaseoli]
MNFFRKIPYQFFLFYFLNISALGLVGSFLNPYKKSYLCLIALGLLSFSRARSKKNRLKPMKWLLLSFLCGALTISFFMNNKL